MRASGDIVTFGEALQNRQFVITAEMQLDRGSGAGDIKRQCGVLKGSVDALQIADSPLGRTQWPATVAGPLVMQLGIDVIAQLGCRDRNRIALENELLGLGAAEVKNVLLMRGDELPPNHRPRVAQVYELGGRELIACARELADDPTVPAVPEFLIGAPAMVFSPRKAWQPSSLIEKIRAGARFVQTQLCYDIRALERYMSFIVDARLTWRCAVIVSMSILPSAMAAAWVRENVRGSLLPQRYVKRLEQARDPEQEGVELVAELLQKLQEVPGIDGAHLMTPGDQDMVAAAIAQAGIRQKN